MVKILSGTYGDNLARRDVTASLKSKAEGGNLEVTASEELIPAFEVSEETKLTTSDLNDIDRQAQEQCGGAASDTACVQATKAKLMRQKHEEKANTDNSAANIIAGRSLTVNYIDAKGVVKRAVVPDGQKFKLDGVEFTNKQGTPEPMKWAEYEKVVMDALNVGVWTAVFVFSVASSYRVFKRYGNLPIAIGITFLAIALPLGGAPAYIGVIFILAINAFTEMGRQSKLKAMAEAGAAAPAAPAAPLAAIPDWGMTNPMSAIGNLKSRGLSALQGVASNPLAAIPDWGTSNPLKSSGLSALQGLGSGSAMGELQGLKQNPMSALKGLKPGALLSAFKK
jgi:hypothetical protein